MSYTGSAGTAAAVAHETMINAIKACGAIIRIEAREFQTILNKVINPLVVYSKGGFLKVNHQYLTSYKGLIFYTNSDEPLHLPSKVEVVGAGKIWIPK